jgi:hypothetical protein
MATTFAPVQVSVKAGLSGFLCEVTGDPMAFADCLACARNARNTGCPFPAAIVERIVSGIRPPDLSDRLATEHGATHGFSATELLHCPRRLRLERINPWYEKLSSMFRMMRGTGVHDYLDGYPEGLKATRLAWTFKFLGQTITLSGMPDLVEKRPAGLFVTDYKVTENPPRDLVRWICTGCEATTSRSKSGFLCPNCGQISRQAAYRSVEPLQARSTHVWQINLYCLLIEKNLSLVTTAMGVTGIPSVLGGEVVYLPPNLPLRCAVPFNRDGTLAFLKDRLRILLSPDLPPVLAEDDEGRWECNYCSLREVCQTSGS